MRLYHLVIIFFLLLNTLSCWNSRTDTPVESPVDPLTLASDSPPEIPEGHINIQFVLTYDPETSEFQVKPDRSGQTHLDLAYFWKYYPNMLTVQVLDLNPSLKQVELKIIFANPLEEQLRDVRMIFIPDSPLKPVNFDGWTIRSGAPIEYPDTYFTFGIESEFHAIDPHASVFRNIVFSYTPPFDEILVPFVLDAVVNDNTAEAYEFGEPLQTGRLLQVAVSDWQDDITSVEIDGNPMGLPVPIQLVKYGGTNVWGTSIPDIPPGNYNVRMTASSPELPGEIGEGEPAYAVDYIKLNWPPDDPPLPLPRGNGIYVYSFTDPDTNTLPVDGNAFMDKFRNDMGGDFLIMEYGEICNSGYLSMHTWVPIYVDWMTQFAPDLPIYFNLDNLGFVSLGADPCHHTPEDYTPKFFENLLESTRGQILENPDFDGIAGLHFDIEIFPSQYDEDTLFEIYGRYADFLADLHLEPALNGRNITVYEFDHHPMREVPSLAYLCTADAFCGEAYYSRFTWQWDPSVYPTGFYELEKILGVHHSWSYMYGRPWYSIPGTFSGWIDLNTDTLLNFTLCPDWQLVLIDDFCFGKGLINTINEYDIVRDHDTHGLYVEKVVMKLDTGEDIFPSNGFIVCVMGDGDPGTESDDYVFLRTSYAMTRTYWTIDDHENALSLGTIVFRYENNQDWKAAAYSNPLGRGDITAVSGQVRFGDGTDIQLHPELWGKITIELIDPLTAEINEHPSYMKSIDIVGVLDGSYIFPDLPRDLVTIQASAEGWISEPVTLNLTQNFAYVSDVDLILNPI